MHDCSSGKASNSSYRLANCLITATAPNVGRPYTRRQYGSSSYIIPSPQGGRGPHSRQAVQAAELVAVGVAQVGEVEAAAGALSRRVFDRDPAVGEAGGVPGVRFRRGLAGEAEGCAVGDRGRVAVDRLGDAEDAGRRHVEEAALRIDPTLGDAQRAKRRVVEFLGPIDVVRADEDVREHGGFLSERVGRRRGSPPQRRSSRLIATTCATFYSAAKARAAPAVKPVLVASSAFAASYSAASRS